ncbi:hypothetical protein [Mycolicibacterium arenosum]|uniref:MFS transporter n=1 Tax=Mycolicibacterium arenosum TaxID=2952157 RepID=A0ABT1LVI9_9MYCO|nr:hypothetical protein [Mycolicibacterium sp. CAU 1645]MCP9270901.1 hypothetical protein [Mycolicibacterium sp. CAU 1645]
MTTDLAPQHRSATSALRWVAAALSASQLVTPPVIMSVYGDFLSARATNDAVITPAGYAFSIWGLITLLCTVSFVGVARRGLNAPWETRLLVEVSVVFTGFTAWLLVAAQDWLWLSVAVFAVMVVLLIDVMRLLVRHADQVATPTWLRRLTTTSLGLYLGWSSIAVCVNVAAALIDGGWSPSEYLWQAVVLVVATLVGLGLTVFVRADLGYVAAVLWAFVAVVIGAAQNDAVPLSVAAAAASVLVLVTAVVLRVRDGRTGHHPVSTGAHPLGHRSR